jgi:hypothetical protein
MFKEGIMFKQREIKIENVGALEKGKVYIFKVDEMPTADLVKVRDQLKAALKKCKAFGIFYIGNIEVEEITPFKRSKCKTRRRLI